MAFLRCCYHQILGPRRYLPKFANSLCRHAGAYVPLNPHLGWQATEAMSSAAIFLHLYRGIGPSLIALLGLVNIRLAGPITPP
jgi:hypothetical protein